MDDFSGIERLQAYIAKKAEQASPARIAESQEKGAEYIREQMRGRSSPRRKGTMLSSFAYESDKSKGETTFGWGKFYGRLVESGHNAGGFARKKKPSVSRVKAQPHLKPMFEANKENIFRIMIEELERG